MGLGKTLHLLYPLLNNLDTGCTICFYTSTMNNFIFVIILILFSIDFFFLKELFSIDSAYNVSSRYIFFLT